MAKANREALQVLGASRVEATLVDALLKGKPISTKQLVERSGLRQPEVSTGMALLKSRGWVEVESIPRKGKGRPMHKYVLSVGAKAVHKHYQESGKAQISSIQDAIKSMA